MGSLSCLMVGALLFGCVPEPTAPEPRLPLAPVDLHLDDGYIAVYFGSTLIDVWAGGQVVGSSAVVITRDHPTMVSGSFHDAAGDIVKGFDDYELRLEPANAALLKFTRKDAFTGTLTRLSGGATKLDVSLYNTATMTFDFGPFPVPVTVE